MVAVGAETLRIVTLSFVPLRTFVAGVTRLPRAVMTGGLMESAVIADLFLLEVASVATAPADAFVLAAAAVGGAANFCTSPTAIDVVTGVCPGADAVTRAVTRCPASRAGT